MLRRWWERRQAIKELRRVPLFADASRTQLAEIDRLLTEVRVPEGRELMREHERGLDFAVVLDGTAEVRRDGHVLATLESGSFFGELALVGDGYRTATVTAATAMRLYVLNVAEFERLLEVAPSVRAAVKAAAQERASKLAPAA